MVDAGAAITPPGQYTHCVDRKDYRDVPGILDAGLPAALKFLLCEFLLGGKLVCLGGGRDQCAIGTVAGLEAVGAGKKGLEALDNDFSFNVLLAPFQVQDFVAYIPPSFPDTNIVEPHRIRDHAVKHGPLGWLMVDPPNPRPLPNPVDQSGAPGWPFKKKQPKGNATWPMDGYGVLWHFASNHLHDEGQEGDNLHKLHDRPPGGEWTAPPAPDTGQWVPLPVLHCECEGSRIFFACQAMDPFLDLLQGKVPGSSGPSPGEVCHTVADKLPWPLDVVANAVCAIAEDLIAIPIALALAPLLAAAFGAAWEAAQAFDDLFITGPVAKQIHVGDVVIVQGRWDWDAGHSGHTELHPVKAILKLTTPPQILPSEIRPQSADYDPTGGLGIPDADKAAIKATHERWCRLLAEAPPPPDPRQGGGLSPAQLASMTSEQLAVWAAQNRPENSWTAHPLLDGCAPDQPPPALH
ncbi:hypothetical protein [Streptomyces sp. NPDC086182]|jgi:hypothetical protein|uniref:hypothetical protein n=1 Tax=Streptomyces sp. NPDC086182 TaxID=3155058 RepID=UPI00342027B7